MNDIVAVNSCGTANDHEPEWRVSMTAPNGRTGIELIKCNPCMIDLLFTPAVQTLGRTVHLKRMSS